MRLRKQAVPSALANDEYETLVEHIGTVVEKSFEMRPMPSGLITESEGERRVEICGEIWNVLFGDLKWTKDRTREHMLRYLVAVLDGGKLSDLDNELIPAGKEGAVMWAPGKLNDIEPERRLSALAGKDPVILGPKGRN